jgi:type IV pilus assembly protein PilA
MKIKKFTLVEIMVVVAIIAILAAIAVPSLSKNRESTFNQTKIANIKTINNAIAIFLADKPLKSRTDISSFDDIRPYLSNSDNQENDFRVGGDEIVVTGDDVHY